MAKRLQVLLDEREYLEIQRIARRQRVTLSDWVRQALRKAAVDYAAAADTKLSAIADASRHGFPTADIDVMLGEIQDGHFLRSDARG